jgi:hypothetical protein
MHRRRAPASDAFNSQTYALPRDQARAKAWEMVQAFPKGRLRYKNRELARGAPYQQACAADWASSMSAWTAGSFEFGSVTPSERCPLCTSTQIRAGAVIPCPRCGHMIVFESSSADMNIRKALSAARKTRLAANV